jgi:hypothetical protein
VTSIGYQANYNMVTTGNTYSTAVGFQAAKGASGSLNYGDVAVGAFALTAVTTGANNVAVGYQTLQANTTASNNTAVGYQAGYNTTTGASNTVIGYQAGYNLTSGASNVIIGPAAGAGTTPITSGSYNVIIGQNTGLSAATDSYSILISGNTSAGGKGGSTGFIQPGGGGVYQGNNQTLWSVASDQRLKKNIVDHTEGLDKIIQIRVRNFEYRTEDEVTDLPKSQAVAIEGVQLGVIAQELQAVLPDCVKEETTGVLSVQADSITWHMVNAIKDLKAELDTVKAELAALKG